VRAWLVRLVLDADLAIGIVLGDLADAFDLPGPDLRVIELEIVSSKPSWPSQTSSA
jgi:hypothetical protein